MNDPQPALMAIGAHADDLELQVGGTLAKYHRDHGYRIVYVMSTDNGSGGWSTRQEDGTYKTILHPYTTIRPQRLREAAEGARALGTEPIHLNHPQRHYTLEDGTRLELRYGCGRPEGISDGPTILTACEDPEAIGRVAALILEHNPEAVLTHGMPMVNPEHFATSVLVLRAYRQARQNGYRGMLLCWQDLGIYLYERAYARWDTFVDISAHWEEKLALVALHASQKPRPALLDWPPHGSACGCRHAEVFTFINRGCFEEQHRAFTLEVLNHAR